MLAPMSPDRLGGLTEELPRERLLSDGARWLSEGVKGEEDRGADGGVRPFPLPRIRPPPSFRADIVVYFKGVSLDRDGCGD